MEIDVNKLAVVAKEFCIKETELEAKTPCQGEEPDCLTCWIEVLKKDPN